MAYLSSGVIHRIVVYYIIPKVMQPEIFIPVRQAGELTDPTVEALIEDCAVFWESALRRGETMDFLTQVLLRFYTCRPPPWDDDIEFVQMRMLSTAKLVKARLESTSHATRGLVEVNYHWSQIFWLGDRGWHGLHTTFRRKRLRETFKLIGIADCCKRFQAMANRLRFPPSVLTVVPFLPGERGSPVTSRRAVTPAP